MIDGLDEQARYLFGEIEYQDMQRRAEYQRNKTAQERQAWLRYLEDMIERDRLIEEKIEYEREQHYPWR